MPTPAKSAADRPRDEKITINLGVVDLGRIDLLVQEGFYSTRSDLIRAAIRAELDKNSQIVREIVERRTFTLGLRHFRASDLEAARSSGERLEIRVLGLAILDDDIGVELAVETIASLAVLGSLQARPELKQALADRILS